MFRSVCNAFITLDTETVNVRQLKLMDGPYIETSTRLYVVGKKAYEYARKNEEIVLKANKIIITEIELLEYSLPKIVLRVVCGKGTYIRSLAYDLGKELNSGAHLIKLIRSRIGDYNLDSSMTIEEFGGILSTL